MTKLLCIAVLIVGVGRQARVDVARETEALLQANRG
jgi:hypothetical protein